MVDLFQVDGYENDVSGVFRARSGLYFIANPGVSKKNGAVLHESSSNDTQPDGPGAA